MVEQLPTILEPVSSLGGKDALLFPELENRES